MAESHAQEVQRLIASTPAGTDVIGQMAGTIDSPAEQARLKREREDSQSSKPKYAPCEYDARRAKASGRSMVRLL